MALDNILSSTDRTGQLSPQQALDLLRTLTLLSHLFYLQGTTGYWFDPSPAFWKSAIFALMTTAYLIVNAIYLWAVLRGKKL